MEKQKCVTRLHTPMLHNTYNSAADHPCDLSVLNKLLDLLAWEWAPFSALELMEALAACSSLSSPGPDHITWVHLKKVVAKPQCLNVFIKLANACLTVGCWPKHFKESVLVSGGHITRLTNLFEAYHLSAADAWSSLLSTSLNHRNPVDPVDSGGFPVDSTRLHYSN